MFAMFKKGKFFGSAVPTTPTAGTKIVTKEEEFIMLKSKEGTVPPSQTLRNKPRSLVSVMPEKENATCQPTCLLVQFVKNQW